MDIMEVIQHLEAGACVQWEYWPGYQYLQMHEVAHPTSLNGMHGQWMH